MIYLFVISLLLSVVTLSYYQQSQNKFFLRIFILPLACTVFFGFYL